MRTGKTVTQEHSYATQTVPATCTQQGYTLYTCACGDSYKDNFVEVQEHNYGLNGDEPYCLWCGEPRGDVIIPPITPVDPPISQFSFTPSISIHLNATETATYHYTYNGGQLTQMELSTSTIVSLRVTTESHVLTFTYDANGNPQTVDYDDFTYYYVVNLQGDIIAITDTTGDVVVSYTYDAWGNILSTTGTMATTLGKYNPIRYRGYVYDTETQLYYLQSRYYNPTLGRFLNADALVSTGQGMLGNNMFAYCGNNPVVRCDVSGQSYTATCFSDKEPFFNACMTAGTSNTTSALMTLFVMVVVIDAIQRYSSPKISIEDHKRTTYLSDSSDISSEAEEDDDYYDNDDNFGGKTKVGKPKGNTPGNNQKQNKQFRDITKHLDAATRRAVHEAISKQGMGYQEIVAFIKDLGYDVSRCSFYE